MPCNNALQANNCSFVDELSNNIDSVVTIYTEGCCFTGLLVGLTCDVVKLITRSTSGCPGGRSCFGRITLIRICQIEAVTFCNTSL